MKKVIVWLMSIFCSGLLIAFAYASASFADSIIIKYRSGKIQKITLEESQQNIESIDFSVDGKAEFTKPDHAKPQDKSRAKEYLPTGGGIRLKWAEPKAGD